MKKIRYLLLLGIFPATVIAQNRHNIVGIVTSKNVPIGYVSITNTATQKVTISNGAGVFGLAVKENDLLWCNSVGYSFDTIRISQEDLLKDTIRIQLKEFSQSLPAVVVSNHATPYQLDSAKRREAYFGTRSSHKLPATAIANSGAGFGINLDYFYKKEKQRSKWIDMFEVMEQDAYINYRFTPELVAGYTHFSGDSLYHFIQKYRPSAKWLRKHKTEEDMLYYINEKLKLFFKK